MRLLPTLLASASWPLMAMEALPAEKSDPVTAATKEAEWQLVFNSSKISIYNRPNADPKIQDVKAIGIIKAPPTVVRRVLNDTDSYPSFMPYVIESRLLARENGDALVYQRLSPPLMTSLDYIMHIRTETIPGVQGYRIRIDAAHDSNVAEKRGVARLKVLQGHWMLEPSANGTQTRLTYWLYSDCGKIMSSRLVSIANRYTIPKMFKGIAQQAMLTRYTSQK